VRPVIFKKKDCFNTRRAEVGEKEERGREGGREGGRKGGRQEVREVEG
jgi:hypothetical protein